VIWWALFALFLSWVYWEFSQLIDLEIRIKKAIREYEKK
jgi:hypothetical protein